LFAQIKTYYQTLIPELTNESWSKVEEKFTFQYLKKGELLTRNGEVCKQVSFINRGLLRMFYLVDGKEICTAFAKETTTSHNTTAFLPNSLPLEVSMPWKVKWKFGNKKSTSDVNKSKYM
jgi:hypothetical protein